MSLKFQFNERVLRSIIALQDNTDFQTLLQDGLVPELDKRIELTLLFPDNAGELNSTRGEARCLTMLFTAIADARADAQAYDQKPT